MATTPYNKSNTGIILIDPYNDFLSEGGKLWPYVKDTATKANTVVHLKNIVDSARKSDIQVFYVPHRRWEPGDYKSWKYPTPYQLQSAEFKIFEKGTWGGEFHSDFIPTEKDIIIKEHWSSSGFANTDLDQQLKQHGVQRIIVIGLLANTCAETTAKFGTELGYEVTLVTDATAAYNEESMNAAHKLNGPTFAHHILTTEEVIRLMGLNK